MLSYLFLAALWSPAWTGLTSWFSCVLCFLVFCHFPIGCLLQVWYLIVSTLLFTLIEKIQFLIQSEWYCCTYYIFMFTLTEIIAIWCYVFRFNCWISLTSVYQRGFVSLHLVDQIFRNETGLLVCNCLTILLYYMLRPKLGLRIRLLFDVGHLFKALL